jgi:hypothetical protein
LGANRAAERAKALAEIRAAEQQALNTTGWIDKGKGVVRLRIDDALRIMEHEWPKNPAATRSNLFERVAKATAVPPKPPVFALIASIKFHGPNFLADIPWLTDGRVRPAHVDCLLYGFCLQAGVALSAWLFGRLGRARLAYPLLALAGVAFYNFGVAAGVFGILAGMSIVNSHHTQPS